MNMTNCEYCNSVYTKRGINRHLKFCIIKAQEERKDIIIKLLADKGCELRSDSRLCRAYIEDGEGHPERIAEIMEEMNFYINHTDYYVELDECIESMLKYKGRYDIDEESCSAKLNALIKWCEQYVNIENIDYDLLPNSLHNDAINIIKNRTKKERMMVSKKKRMGVSKK
jgi:hypothetical protein